ncbi:hypothetical protein BLS_001117 [Venturia inaequalis]|uniref:Uncharacterized protein n=1 Tax=Venturia inaequalis TaxID=5025 RepID=A0A8H3YIU3_VENIN|nr:hypothetical protein BLS_001117 [Venturia inaequalis]KAE9966540.1 hypothetical protein EG328_008868 [Venturia inaequalis]RDI78574.1 DNA polymerase epsilon catalytic subunit A [Venturia inaequalis]
MGLMNMPRDLLAFPQGDNSTDTIINGLHFNTTTLKHWNYTLYSNNTISNNSKCYLVFDQWKPVILSNGSWVNATTCYVPIQGIAERGKLGIAFASIFAVSIMFTLVNLKKHGQQLLREDRRFRLTGRRWQWYWMLFTATCAIASCITSVDVDRDYLQDLAIVLQSFFYVLMFLGVLAVVWEATRHWGSWQERQIVDIDPYTMKQDDRRANIEFYLPLLFYFFWWLTFFMVIPRSWSKIEKQHSVEQQQDVARPAGTDVRFKAGAILACVTYFVILFDLRHNMHYYKPSQRPGIWNGISNFCLHCPTKLFLSIVILSIRLAYNIVMAWQWELSIFKFNGNPAWFYGLGYAPTLLIIIIFNIAGYIDENEDQELMNQRRVRNREADAEIGITKRPAWWKKGRALDDEARLRDLMTDAGGRRSTANRTSGTVEMIDIPPQNSITSTTPDNAQLRDRSRSRPRDGDPFTDRASDASSDGSPDGLRPALGVRGENNRSMSVATDISNVSAATGLTGRTLTSENGRPARVRSMLDI